MNNVLFFIQVRKQSYGSNFSIQSSRVLATLQLGDKAYIAMKKVSYDVIKKGNTQAKKILNHKK